MDCLLTLIDGCLKKNPKFLLSDASERISGAFNVWSDRTLHDRCCCCFIKEPDFGNVFISRYIFYLVGTDTARN
jgi:hypothetical protein